MRTWKFSSLTAFASFAIVMLAMTSCEPNLPIDDPFAPPTDPSFNPGAPKPQGAIRGTLTYLGPPPCTRDGKIAGVVGLLLFDYDNPPPPAGLASGARNFATIPGEILFASYPRPVGAPAGQLVCPPLDAPQITASADYSLQQLPAGRYQLRAIYSRKGDFNPLFNFSNLPVAGDTVGGAVVDPRAASPVFLPITIGTANPVEADRATAPFVMPAVGFVSSGVPVVLGITLPTTRPYFHIDVANSRGFRDLTTLPKDFFATFAKPEDPDPRFEKTTGDTAFPQDLVSTSRTNIRCFGKREPECDGFEFAQASFPQIRVKFGFPGDAADPSSDNGDAWLAKSARISAPFFPEKARPFYAIDPQGFDTPASKGIVLTRNFSANGAEILHDNTTLETIAEIADLFPAVVLTKLFDDPATGMVADPPRTQTNPLTIISTFTLRGHTMKASSQSTTVGGGLSLPRDQITDGKTTAPDPAQPLSRANGAEVVSDMSFLVRPSVVCIRPNAPGLPAVTRGTLVTTVKTDPTNKVSATQDAILVEPDKILKFRGDRVNKVEFGCLPPGHYSVNLVYPSGQAWSVPNLTGVCSYRGTVTSFPFLSAGEVIEDCRTPVFPFDKASTDSGFGYRPMLRSQQVYRTDANGRYMEVNGTRVPQIITILPSARCMQKGAITAPLSAHPVPEKAKFSYVDSAAFNGELWTNNAVHEDVNANGKLEADEDKNGNNQLDMRIHDDCLPIVDNDSLAKFNTGRK